MPSGQHRKFLVNICLLIVLRVYLVQTLKTYLRILKRLCKPINSPIGADTCPMMYVSDIIIPRVIEPSTTDLAAM